MLIGKVSGFDEEKFSRLISFKFRRHALSHGFPDIFFDNGSEPGTFGKYGYVWKDVGAITVFCGQEVGEKFLRKRRLSPKDPKEMTSLVLIHEIGHWLCDKPKYRIPLFVMAKALKFTNVMTGLSVLALGVSIIFFGFVSYATMLCAYASLISATAGWISELAIKIWEDQQETRVRKFVSRVQNFSFARKIKECLVTDPV